MMTPAVPGRHEPDDGQLTISNEDEMIIDEVRATLAIEGLDLTPAEQRQLQDFIDGRLTLEDLRQVLSAALRTGRERQAA